MRIELSREPRNEELIAKIAQTKGNTEAIEALWRRAEYSQVDVLDSLLYACEDGLIAMKIDEDHLAERLEDNLYDWFSQELGNWVKDESGPSSIDEEREN